MPKNNLKIEGTVLEKKDKNIVIQTNRDKLKITLKEDIPMDVGDKVVLSKNKIDKMEIVKKQDLTTDKYDTILKSMGLETNEDNIQAIKEMEESGVKLSRENIGAMVTSKECLQTIKDNLDYNMVIKLEEKGIDIQKESLYKIAKEIKEIQEKNNKESKEIIYNDAQKIAKKIYGKEVGKDLLDIIKSLKTDNLEITKDTIENTYKILNKLDSIKDIEDKFILQLYNDKETISISALYNLKNNVTNNSIELNDLSATMSNIYEQSTIVSNVKDKVKNVRVAISNIKDNITPKIVEKLGDSYVEKEEVEKLSKEIISKEEPAPIDYHVDNSKDNNLVLVKGLKRGIDVNRILDKVQNITPEQINYQINKNMSFTLNNIEKAYDELNLMKLDYDKSVEISHTKINEIQTEYEETKNTLTIDKIIEMTKNSLNVLNMNISEINKYKINKTYDNKNNIIKNISKYDNKTLPIILKNSINLTLDEINKVQGIIKGETTFMETIEKALTSMETSPIIEEQIKEVKKMYKHISDKIKNGENIKDDYENLINTIESMNNSDLSQENSNTKEEFNENIKLYKKLNNKDTFIDLPIEINGNMKNMQIYIKNKEISSKEINMLLHINTNNLGKLQMDVSLKGNKVHINIDSKEDLNQASFYEFESFLIESIKSVGYELKNLTIGEKIKENITTQDTNYKSSFIDMKV